MRKIIFLMLTIAMTIAVFTACGNGDSAGSGEPVSVDSLKTIGDAMALDSDETQTAVFDDMAVYVFKIGDTYYRAKAPISEETAQAFFDIDYSDEDYEAKQKELITSAEISEIENLNEQILSQDECDALVGKTGQELQDEGWSYAGHDLATMEFWMNYGPFLYTVTFDGTVAEADYEDFDDEEGTKTMAVKSVVYNTLGDGATDIE